MVDPAWEKELMWAAGFWDGEGCCNLTRSGTMNLIVCQRHPEVLERFRAAFQVGNVTRSMVRGKWFYRWAIQGVADVAYVHGLLYPRVSPVKQRQFDSVAARARIPDMKGSDEYRAKLSRNRRAYWATRKVEA